MVATNILINSTNQNNISYAIHPKTGISRAPARPAGIINRSVYAGRRCVSAVAGDRRTISPADVRQPAPATIATYEIAVSAYETHWAACAQIIRRRNAPAGKGRFPKGLT